MPCIFCLAVLAIVVGSVTTAVVDALEAKLSAVAAEGVTRTTDSASVARFDLAVPIPPTVADRSGRTAPVPVAVTVYKKHKRVRIQVMTHDVTREEAEAIEDAVAAALEAEILERSDAHDEALVRKAFGEEATAGHEHASPAAEHDDDAKAAPATPRPDAPAPAPAPRSARGREAR